MINFTNKDLSFFEIKQTKTKKKSATEGFTVDNAYVISLSITEEIGKIMSGSIQFYDPDYSIARHLHVGYPLDIKWGYQVPDIGIKSLLTKNQNELEMVWQREGIRAVVQSPSGSMGSDGITNYNCNFYATYSLGTNNYRVFKKGVKADVIKELFADMELNPDNTEIKFARGDEVITKDTQVIQKESNFRFLLRLAREWGACYRVSYKPDGELYGLFIDYTELDKSKFANLTTGALIGNTVYFNYRGTTDTEDIEPNIISASWKNHAGDSGYGDNVRITIVNGQPIFTRFVTKGEEVTAWRLNPKAIKDELKKQKNFGARLEITKKWLSAENFEQVKRFFKPVTDTTAPQGLGYSVTIEMPGLPQVTAPLRAKFGSGFPPFFSQANINFYVSKVTHKIDSTGYKMSVECADHYTITGGSLI